MLLSQRNSTQKKNNSHTHKPKFYTKSRLRTKTISSFNLQLLKPQHIKIKTQPQPQTDPNKTLQPYLLTTKKQCQLDNNNNDTSLTTKLQNINFSHHNPQICVCQLCSCGRHLCQFHSIKPNLTKNTIYQKDFMKKKPINNKINISSQYQRLKGPYLQPNTTYCKDFIGKPSKPDKFHPTDNLKLSGPCQQLTSYSSNFPGHHGQNQYVRYTDKCTRGYLPLRSQSTYSQSFTGNQPKNNQCDKRPDHFKTGSNWFGSTTYGNCFKKPKQDDYTTKYEVKEKLETNPNFVHQYETIYKNSFINHKSNMCPAKVKLQTKIKGSFSDQKDNFSQNTDFKSLDPNYQSFSSSQFKWI